MVAGAIEGGRVMVIHPDGVVVVEGRFGYLDVA